MRKQMKQRSVVQSFAGNYLASQAPTVSELALSQDSLDFSHTSLGSIKTYLKIYEENWRSNNSYPISFFFLFLFL